VFVYKTYKTKRFFPVAAVTLAVLNIAALLLTRLVPRFADFFSDNVYPFWVKTVGFVVGFLPFSLWEALIAAFILAVIIFIIFHIVKKRFPKGKTWYRLLTALLAVLLVFNIFCGVNYYREPFSAQIGLTTDKYTKEQLLSVIDILTVGLEDSEPTATDNNDLPTLAVLAMSNLSDKYAVLRTNYPKPKPILTARYTMSPFLVCGIYSALTAEANYNNDMPQSDKPFTICHELSHLSGFMQEEEANFIAFLACAESDDPRFRRSGYIRAVVYALNAYSTVATAEEYDLAAAKLPASVQEEIAEVNDYWKPFRNTKPAKVSSAVNDTYLKVNGQSEGERSYGRMVDLLIAYYI
jgi:hypothetical protein